MTTAPHGHRAVGLRLLALCGMLLLAGAACESALAVGNPARNVEAYARVCFKALKIQRSDLDEVMDCKSARSEELEAKHNGASVALDTCDERNGVSCALPRTCDHRAWLSGECYGNSHLTTFTAKSNADVTGALLCRHKARNTDDPRQFDDIAIILHNRKNGETCWFQALSDSSDLDGRAVPHPMKPGARLFWLDPKETRDINCISCHDSGPFITSPWLNQAKGARLLRDLELSAYLNSTPPFDKWPKPVFISVGRTGLTESGDKPCTACHHIGTFRGQAGQTCSRWIDYSTRTGALSPSDSLVDGRIFMPPRMRNPLVGKFHPTDWTARYGNHVSALKSCCDAFANDAGFAGDATCRKEN